MSKNILVFGGSGALGAEIVNFFTTKGWSTVAIDFRANTVANKSIVITNSGETEMVRVATELNATKFDSIICAAGGWTGGSITSEDYFKSVQKMLDMNLSSAIGTAYLSGKLLSPGGLVVFTGANSALVPTPGMIGYGVSKVATHQIVKSLAQADSGLPANSLSIGILPVILDTPSNRAGMPDSNFDNWTPVSDVASKLFEWSSDSTTRPANGSLVTIETKNKATTFTLV
ncbi:hypothetical protein SAMD00019534_112260 [Acytostelium subglobosum LB1]|uniref:hypothetical protein n=1 Tax=Acytostelium subglobosum LB1 TaxID=1410327 RepID=UPI000644F933|nr:hypothetical protein SAMD00019534_112260 [Acytostelium subglobosum LB1]GAM28050.1 hypothetical protein SAMD00019534_112260 [Acytostelium subglobosum LB1]|eukprot:XP_012749009.1 hypothetical protein SAMD00019534_112260 [Acytostelium subglobosum LB1]